MLTVSQKTKTCAVELLNDSIEFRTTIVKPYLKKSDSSIQDPIQNPIQDPIQDSIQGSIQDFIQDSIQSENLVQSSKDSTSRRNPPRPRQRPTHFQNNITDITIYMFKFISPFTNF